MRKAAALLAVLLAGCSSFGASGPRTAAVVHAAAQDPRIRVVALDDAVTRGVLAAQHHDSFAGLFGTLAERHGLIGVGDVLDISLWEAPPAVLFSSGLGVTGVVGPSVARSADLPPQMVDNDGTVAVPFAGRVAAAGRSPGDVGREIVRRLAGKAHDPQAIVRISSNQAADVTVVGDVASSRRVPLTTHDERLLDALAGAGGVRNPVDKVVIQVTRGGIVASRPLGAIIRDPAENVPLARGDVITALYQPWSFQALGALGTNAEVPFEATGISLAQALARVGGLQDNRADVKGLFVFRLEDPAALPEALRTSAPLTPEGKVPVIYRLDMANPSSFFVLQSFPMKNRDILYVSNAPLVDFQKFVNLVSQLAFSVAGVTTTVP